MPTSNAKYDQHTTGRTVVSAFPEQVKDKIILITGANPGGIGSSTATSLATASPKLLILAGRGEAKLAETTAEVKKVNPDVACKSLILDLSSQQSCRKAAREILDDPDIPRIDILINNAGVMNIPDRTLSPEGIEMQFATNHVGHYLFTNLIFPKLEAAAKTSSTPGSTRIINVSSRAVVYSAVRFSDYNFTKLEADMPKEEHLSQSCRNLWDEHEDKTYIPQAAYGQSKTANVLFSVELNKRLLAKSGILSAAVHPGGIATQLSRNMDPEKLEAVMDQFRKASPTFHMKNLDEGCSTTLVAALDPKLEGSEVYLADCQVAGWAPGWCTDPRQAEMLWKLSEKLVGQEFDA